MKDVVFWSVAISVILVMLYGCRNTFLLCSKGKSIAAKVVKKEDRTGPDGGYFISYRFQSANGTPVESAPIPVSLKTFNGVSEGGTINVRYLEERPGCHMIASEIKSNVTIGIMILAFFAMCILWYTSS